MPDEECGTGRMGFVFWEDEEVLLVDCCSFLICWTVAWNNSADAEPTDGGVPLIKTREFSGGTWKVQNGNL